MTNLITNTVRNWEFYLRKSHIDSYYPIRF